MKKAMISFVTVVVLSILITSLTHASERIKLNRSGSIEERHKLDRERATTLLASVDYLDGVDMNEAYSIATAYFMLNVGCGGFDRITEEKDNWVANGSFGYAGEPYRVLIDKHTGIISSPMMPDLNKLREY